MAWRSSQLHSPEIAPFKHWLLDRGSLTARLQRLGTFSVAPLRQGLEIPNRDETQILRLRNGKLAWRREVTLFCNDRPLVFAHTVMSRQPRGPMLRWLGRLGNRSFGALLFAHPGFVRGPIEVRQLDARHPLFLPATVALGLAGLPPKTLWARRSPFFFGEQGALVTEVFSPEVAHLKP